MFRNKYAELKERGRGEQKEAGGGGEGRSRVIVLEGHLSYSTAA